MKTPNVKLILRAILSFLAAVLLSRMYFGGMDWGRITILAGFMLLVSYVFEAMRGR